jgi:Domain of unknown function (DUF4190)
MAQVYSPTPMAPPNNRQATTSLVSGIVAWVLWLLFFCFNWSIGAFLSFATVGITGVLCGIASFFPVIPWVLAIVTGHLAISQIKRTGEPGRGLAIAGLVMGYAGIVITLCTFGFYILGIMGIAAASFLPSDTFGTPVPFLTPTP